MTTFIVFNELKYIEYNSFYDIFGYNYFILYGIFMTFFNYYVRGVWTYGIANMYTKKDGNYLQFNASSLFSSITLYSYKYIFEIFYK